jgi:hypothetical protein
MKQINLRLLVTLSLSVITLFALSVTAFAQGDAEEQTIYKVGDRVEVDPQAHDPSSKYKTWHKATVTKIGPVGGGVHGYYVTVDAEGDSGPLDVYVRTGVSMIRPLQGAEKNNTKPGGQDQEKQTAPEREQKAAASTCPPSDVATGKTSNDIFKNLILDQYVHKSTSEQDPTTTVTFQTLKIGAPHSWRPGIGGESPDGAGGRAGATVYPVKAVFTVCTDVPAYKPSGFKGWLKTHQDNTTFYCFKNQFGEWQCNLDASTKSPEKYTNK